MPRLLGQLCWKCLLCASGLDIQPRAQEGCVQLTAGRFVAFIHPGGRVTRLCLHVTGPCSTDVPKGPCRHRNALVAGCACSTRFFYSFACAALVCKPMLMHLRFFREKNSTFFTVVHCSGPQILPTGFESSFGFGSPITQKLQRCTAPAQPFSVPFKGGANCFCIVNM